MIIKKIYPILIITAAISLIIAYGISEGKLNAYAFAEIFSEDLRAGEEAEETEETFKEAEETEETFEEAEPFVTTAKDVRAILTFKELMYYSEIYEEEEDEIRAEEAATSRGAFRFNSKMDMVATAYDLSYESCGKYPDHPEYGITASGTKAQPGTVAVDPDVIPLGTNLYIASTDGSPDYGFATALDTGSAIKGYRVDLFMEDKADALNFGVRQVKVYILE